MSLVLLFPGQGSQYPGYLHALPTSPTVENTITAAYATLGAIGIDDDLDSASALVDTTKVQLGLLIAGVACARALTEEFALRPQFVAGHSVGAFAAAVTAGALTLPEALEIVVLRGQFMTRVCAQGHWGMAAVTGLATRTAREMVAQLYSAEHPLWLANINSASQSVISGTTEAIRAATEAARLAGAAACDVLDVSVASHCPLQNPTAVELADRLSTIPDRPLTASYLTNTRGRRVWDAHAVRTDLAESVAQTVRWYDIARLLPELGAACAIEMPPGHVLTRLMESSAPSMTRTAVAVDGLAKSAARCAGCGG